jgi:hypothetical protein
MSLDTLPAPDGQARRAVWLLGAAVFLATCLLSQPSTGWNVNSRFDLVFAVVDHHTLSIDAYHDTPPYETGDKAVYNGHYYSDKTIGLALLGVPAYAFIRAASSVVGHRPGVSITEWMITRMTVAPAAALVVMLLAWLLMMLGALPRRAIVVAAGVFSGSMLFGYSTVFLPYVPGIAACFAALVLVLGPPLTLRRAAAAGGLLGMALILDLTFVIVVAIIGVLMVLRLRPLGWRGAGTRIAATVAAAAIPLGVFAAYCLRIFGSLSIPYKYEYSDYFRTEMAKGVMGATAPKVNVMWFLAIHPYRGIFFWSPWVLVALAGCVWIARRDIACRPFAVAAAVAFVGYFLFNSGYYLWWGGTAMGPRLMLPMFAVVPLVLSVACRAESPRWMWPTLAATLLVSVAMSLPVGMIDPQPVEGNTREVLLRANPRAGLHVSQLTNLRQFYSLRWSQLRGGAHLSLTVSFLLCLTVLVGGTVLAQHRIARPDVVTEHD